ncbi:unnamed protein product [Rhizophagus irregularis]|nr:unnamed protein product [Rhizophagus irregularis]
MTTQASTQIQVIPKFGEQKKAFSIDELKRLVGAAKSMSDLDQAKRYLCSYFIPCSNPHGFFMWRSEIKNLEHIPDKNISSQLYLNIFPGFLHILRPISTFESVTHQAVKFIFSHIQDIWCSGDWNLIEYIIKWLAGVSAGRKMYSILYLKSGQGWGKGIITDFIQRSVLGTQLVYKTSDPQTILGSFNAQLQGKVLLLLEEMPTEKSQWNNLYRSLKDKVTSNIMEIHEKYKTPTHYKNFMSTIVLTNENALRVENDDRRTVFLDVSPSRKGDLNYFKKLNDAMKYPGASEAFYAYLRAIADAYPDFNGNPPPMTASTKQDHIISTLPPLFQFIKDTYLVVKNHMTDLPVQEFYRVYTSYCETHCITPLSKINASRILSNELDINSDRVYIDKKRTRVYSISREDLYKKFLAKKWIHEIDEIYIEGIDTETPEKPASDPKALEKFLVKIYNPANNPQDVQEKPVEEKPTPVEEKPTEEKPAPVVPKKTPPPVPPKPNCLKVKPAPVIKEEPDEEPDQEDIPPAEEPVPEADDDYDVLDDLLSDQTPEQQPESPAESSVSVTKPDPEPVVEPAPEEQPIPEPDTEPEDDWDPEPKQGTKAHWAWYERHRWDCKPWVKNSKDQEVVDRFKDWIEYNGDSPKAPSRKELADLIRAYKEDHDAEIIPTPSGCKTMKMNTGKAREIPEERPKTDMEREWEAANGLVDELDIDEACDMFDSI